MTSPDEIARINALTTNARNTWLVMLGVLVFVGITLMGVQHVDFYGVGRETDLPLVNVAVPTFYFFVAAPILTVAIYGYFHLYLIRLWDALSTAKPQYDGRRLGDIISPWLVSDAALHSRKNARNDYCTTARTMETPAMILNIALAWVLGPLILALLCWQSLPARTFWLSAIASVSFVGALVVGISSWVMMRKRMRSAKLNSVTNLWKSKLRIVAIALGMVLLLYKIYLSTEGPTEHLTSLDLTEEQIVERPSDWLPFEVARKEFSDPPTGVPMKLNQIAKAEFRRT